MKEPLAFGQLAALRRAEKHKQLHRLDGDRSVRPRILAAAGATIVVALCGAAVVRTFALAPGMWASVATVLGWLTLTLLAVSGVGLIVALAAGGTPRSQSIYRDLDPSMLAELRHRREDLRGQRSHERQRP